MSVHDNFSIVAALLSISGNHNCIECNSNAVEWVSVNIGVFLCQTCSSRHRQLGVQISRVRSLDTNIWTHDLIQDIKYKGNANAKSHFESRVPLYQVRPPNDVGPAVIEDWIRCKYQQQLFIDPNKTDNTYYSIPRPITDDSKSNASFTFGVHKMPISPRHTVMQWVTPTEKYQTKPQWVVLHSRFLCRYATPASHKCEQIIDITLHPVWISESYITKPCIMAVGPDNINDGMRFEFEQYKDAKYWTELIRKCSHFYLELGKKSSAKKYDDTINSLLSCNLSDLDNTSAFKHLKYGNVKRQQKFSIGWDKKWWSINLKRKILVYFNKDPRSIKPSKRNPLFIEAQGGFYLNEIMADIDNDGYRSGQQHCLLLYTFSKTLFIKFEQRWPLIEFWKQLHLKGRDVTFIGNKAQYYEKEWHQENLDVQIMLIKQKSPKVSAILAAKEHKETLEEFNMESYSRSPSGSPDAPPTYDGTLTINGVGIGTAILHHELLSADTKMAVTDVVYDIEKPHKIEYRHSITEFNQNGNELQRPRPKPHYGKQKSAIAMLMELKQTSPITYNLSDDEDDEDGEYDMQIDDGFDDDVDDLSLDNKQATLNAPRKRKGTTTATQLSFDAEFGIYSYDADDNEHAQSKYVMSKVSSMSKLEDQEYSQEDSVLLDDPTRYNQLAAPIEVKQSRSNTVSSTRELSAFDDLTVTHTQTGLFRTGIGSITKELQFASEHAPNLPDEKTDDVHNHVSTLSDQLQLSEEEDVMYKDHRRGTVEEFVNKNKHKCRTYRTFGQRKVMESIQEPSIEDSSHEFKAMHNNEDKKLSFIKDQMTKPRITPPPKQMVRKNDRMRQYLLNATQIRKLSDANMMQDILIQVGSVASFFVQPGNKLFVHLHGNALITNDLWQNVEQLLQQKIGALQPINEE